MARNKGIQTNIDNSDLVNYPNGRVKNNDGSGNGTPVNEIVKGDIHEFFDKAMRLYGISHNNLPDNETNGYQLIDAIIALASKNDFILDLTTNSGVLNVPLKLGKLKDNESFIFKATIDKTTETEIKGTLDNITKTVLFVGDFKTGEYVRAINTASNVTLIRLADAGNIDTIVGENDYLKKASQAEEDAGAIDTVATTPLVNKATFTKRVNDNTESAPYLATASQNGVYPKEHFVIVENIASSPIKNTGWLSGVNVAALPIGTNMPVSGDVASATVSGGTPATTIFDVVLSNAMDNVNYFVRISMESLGGLLNDVTVISSTYEITNQTSFRLIVGESVPATQNMKIHIEAVQL